MSDKLKPYFKATTQKQKDGSIDWQWEPGEEKRFKQYLNSLQFKEAKAKIKISVERYRKDASTNQMRYLWGVVYTVVGEYCGIDRYEYEQQIHEPFKAMFLGYKHVTQTTTYKLFKRPIKTIDADIVALVSLTDLDTNQMTKFIEDIRRFMEKEYNCYIPSPNEINCDDLPDVLPEF